MSKHQKIFDVDFLHSRQDYIVTKTLSFSSPIKIINEWGKEWCAAATVSAPGSVRRVSRWNARHGSSAQLRAARVSTGGHSCSVQSWSSECQHHCVTHRTVIRVIAVEVDTSCSLSNKMWHLQGRSCDITLERKIYFKCKNHFTTPECWIHRTWK